jgi:hypothetical protein
MLQCDLTHFSGTPSDDTALTAGQRIAFLIDIRSVNLCLIFLAWATFAQAQQFSSDSWISKPHGVVTLIPTIGERSSMIMNTYSLFPRWEFTMAAYLYNNDGDPNTNDGHSSSLYVKYMFYQNDEETGGAAVKFGTGMFPGYFHEDNRVKDAFRTYWTNMPVTFPLMDNKISWDVMPGASMTINHGETDETSWAFTYATRVAWYPKGPEFALVGEIFGVASDADERPEYKAGLRWEPTPYATFALTYGDEFSGSNGAGFEFGVMLFTPAFACFSGCRD